MLGHGISFYAGRTVDPECRVLGHGMLNTCPHNHVRCFIVRVLACVASLYFCVLSGRVFPRTPSRHFEHLPPHYHRHLQSALDEERKASALGRGRMEAIFTCSVDAICMINERGLIEAFNTAAEKQVRFRFRPL